MTCHVTCPDITKTVTPDLKCPGGATTKLLCIDLGNGKGRMGGSCIAQVYNQIGDISPDVEDFVMFKKSFEATQELATIVQMEVWL